LEELTGTYHPILVAISVAVATASSFVALATVPRIHCSANTRWDTLWSIVFGLSMGTGIWSMHFIGMLAFKLPVPVYYDTGLTLASLILAIVVCAIAVFPLRQGGSISSVRIACTGSLVGCGIAGMHYVGMAAMRMDASMHYSPAVVCLSIAIAIIAASAALLIANHLRATTIFSRMRLKLAAAAAMGLAVSTMHYTAMSSMQFLARDASHNLSGHMDPQFLAITVVVIAILIQGGTLLVALLDEAYFSAKASEQLASQRSEIDQALFSVLEVALEHRPLHEILDRILNILLDIDWLSVEQRGAVFLADQHAATLHMVAHRQLAPELIDKCNGIDFGTCLCGQAALSQKIVHKSCIDDEHVIRVENMTPHGHYCVPILDENKTLGVLNLYVKHGFSTSPLEVQLLESVSNAMAGIIRRKMLEEELKRMSYEDELTGLPNRRRFNETFKHALSLAQRAGETLAVMMLDLDHFKPVNDSYGHDVGDHLLRQVAQRVLACLRDMDTCARVGGDEFIILLEMIQVPDDVEDIGRRVLAALHQPFGIDGHQIRIGASIGVGLYPQDGQTTDALLKQADRSLYRAKETRGTLALGV